VSTTIYKYAMMVDDKPRTFSLPMPGQIVRVSSQHNDAGRVFFWAVVDPNATSTRSRTFIVVGTGHLWPKGARYVGSADISNGTLIWHLLELDR
jgi:hypothetical protein